MDIDSQIGDCVSCINGGRLGTRNGERGAGGTAKLSDKLPQRLTEFHRGWFITEAHRVPVYRLWVSKRK